MDKELTRELLARAVKHCGSQDRLGKLAGGYSQNAIWQAMKRGTVEPQMALGIHRATAGEVSASSLRPDIWPTIQHVPQAAE